MTDFYFADEMPEWIDWKINLMYDAANDEDMAYDLGTCGGCGAYGKVYDTHIRNGEECGQFV